MKEQLGLIILVIAAIVVNDVYALSLNGGWKLFVENIDGVFNVQVPGGIYSDLLQAKLIPDNLKDSNDVNNRWIGNRAVAYIKDFQVDEKLLEAPKVLLVFHGLDTFAKISLNRHEIGNSDNMFVRYVFDVKDHLKIGINELNVTFSSPIKVSKDLYEKQSANYTVVPKCVPEQYNGECHVNHIRKMQASFGWDWGPAFPSMGIWKNVELLPVKDADIFDLSVNVIDQRDYWKIEAKVVFMVGSKNKNEPVRGSLQLKLESDDNPDCQITKEIALNPNEIFSTESMALTIDKSLVNEWWPNGYGEQSLYFVKVQLQTLSGLIEKKKRIGFRKVELVQDPSEKGLLFYFRINDVPMFAKGSNWIPASVFPELSYRSDVIRHLLLSSKEVHMNMLRVWGGGFYESDEFYDLADEYGIMIWQDFMFACSMYPTNPEFMNSVRMEVTQNVERIKHHPSIVLWAGNNENEAALYGNWYGTGKENIYKEDYVKLYANLIKREVEALDVSRPFVVSSPSDGLFTDQNGFIGPDPYSKIYGDIHVYNYINNGWDINIHPISRFSSEYGYQSIPSIETLATATDKIEDLQLGSEFLKHRQHLPAGWFYMKNLISKNFVIPKSLDLHRDFIDYVYLSQINQAMSTKVETESNRQFRSSINDIGEGYTMGALYWQLNDVWQAPSWSSIEFTGRWKMLHYFAADFFAPIIVTPRLSLSNDLTIYIVSDNLSTVSEITLKLNIYNWNSTLPIYVKIYPNITIAANAAQIVDTLWLDKLLEQAFHDKNIQVAKKNCFVELVLEDKEKKIVAPINYVYPALLKDVTLPSAQVMVHVDPNPIPGKLTNNLDYTIQVYSQNIALFVWLEVPHIHGRFSENGFHLIGKTKNITFHANAFITAQELSNSLKVTTLSQLYDPNR